MDRISPAAIASILLTAPAWAQVGLTVRDARLRERAAGELAATIAAQINDEPVVDNRQMALEL